jgi:hypothetical protein
MLAELMADSKKSTETKLQLIKVKLPSTGASVITTVYDSNDKLEKTLRVSFKSVDESMKQDNLSFPLLRRIAKKRHMNLILPAGAELVAHKAGDAYGQEGAKYGSDGHHVNLPTYVNEAGETKPSAFMEFDWTDSDAADDYADSLPANRQFIPLVPVEEQEDVNNPF